MRWWTKVGTAEEWIEEERREGQGLVYFILVMWYKGGGKKEKWEATGEWKILFWKENFLPCFLLVLTGHW